MDRAPDRAASLGSQHPEAASHAGDVPDRTAAIYGSLLVTTMTVVQWQADAVAELIALSLVISIGVFWLTHVWAGLIQRRLGGPVSLADATMIGREEAPMLAAAIAPAAVLALPRLVGMDVDLAIGAALLISLAQLFLWGLAVGRSAHTGWPMALAVACVDCSLGILMVALKVAVLH